MFVKEPNRRFKVDMWADSRLVNATPNFCLCLYCEKSDMPKGIFCPIHEKFMGMTQNLKVSAPIFACPEFIEANGRFDFTGMYFDGKELILPNPALRRLEILHRITEDWKAFKRRGIEAK